MRPERRAWCPICGAEEFAGVRHACKLSVLRAIDAANTRASNGPCPLADPANKPVADKIREGWAILNADGDDE